MACSRPAPFAIISLGAENAARRIRRHVTKAPPQAGRGTECDGPNFAASALHQSGPINRRQNSTSRQLGDDRGSEVKRHIIHAMN
jgi:hypothetical protein